MPTPTTGQRERPIIFSGAMVRAILAGRKTMTRRLAITELKRADNWYCDWRPSPWQKVKPGDRLWVRETWADVNTESGPALLFRADGNYRWCEQDAYPVEYERYPGCHFMQWGPDLWRGEPECRWRSPIHMPRWASRITLEVTAVKIERLQDISEDEAEAEGAEPVIAGREGWCEPIKSYRTGFVRLWNQLHGERAWLDNPEVVAISFRRVPTPGEQ